MAALITIQLILLFGALPPLASFSVLLHPHMEDTGTAAQLAVNPRGAVLGKFVATFTVWLILLVATLPFGVNVVLLKTGSAGAVSLLYYMYILVGAVLAAALTLVSANAPGRKSAVVDSYLASIFLAFIGILFIGTLSDVSQSVVDTVEAAPVSLSEFPAFQSRTCTLVGTGILMPITAILICGFLLMSAAARLTPERGYSSAGQKLFWFTATLVGTIAGLAWASTGTRASSLSQPPVAQMLLLMGVVVALSYGAVVFPTESARVPSEDKERIAGILSSSRLKKLLGPGAIRSSLFALTASAIVLLILVLFLGISEESAVSTQTRHQTVAALYFAVLGLLAMVISLGLLLSTTRMRDKWRRLTLIIVLGVILAVIPFALTRLALALPHVISDMSPLVLAASVFSKGLNSGYKVLTADTIGWTRVIAVYWICAAVFYIAAFIRLRKMERPN
jgi:hypothetical protein